MINFTLEQKFRLSQTLGDLLLAQQASVATVESCTGGGLAYAITEISGSSQWFNQSWVTYANEAKTSMVHVSEDILAQFGAVSKETVEQMALGGQAIANANYCIAVSGIAGPGGGSKDKPVGLVWFAIALPNESVLSFSRRFSGDRSLVREQAIFLGLEKLIECLA
ncbi:CinA family protein [Glaciecola petra]|uniref:Nicotinamide-nucleotide amidohydrolase family protein n=1 Tax=Glaciecola petra TaxID=3075602 RepID=A0ABU2ZLY3_9ALTE|nr:nicotinamide-nucleotide amidohydrolase family protein [Aestuariibacter sp. P117]MDT0593635.1 nicotinamide-nucleotide amidohydrolase family protein [Aestuariibacter sp. P117]